VYNCFCGYCVIEYHFKEVFKEMDRMDLLFSKQICLEDERSMILKYFLVEKNKDLNLLPLYGIQITKYLDDVIETDNVTGISHSKDKVIKLIKKLFQYEVTPISMVEIIDDFVTQGI